MTPPKISPNNVLNPETGFLENPAYINQFDSEKKLSFLKLYKENGLRIKKTCQMLGIKQSTLNKAYTNDPVFKESFDDVEKDYLETLEYVSRTNSLQPKNYVERIFQLKSLNPSKYGSKEYFNNNAVTVNIDSKALLSAIEREKKLFGNVINAEVITDKLGEMKENSSPAIPIDRGLVQNEI